MIPLLPFMYRDGKRVLSSVPKLPPATGPNGQTVGEEPPLRILIIGESTMAGVGVATHAEGFAGAFADALAQGIGRSVSWRVYARSGFTLKRILHEVLPTIEEAQVDMIVVGMGGNEAFKMNTPEGVRRDFKAVIDWLRNRFGPDVPIAFPNMPPIREFTAFTPVLKFTLGRMVEVFGEELAELVKAEENVYYNAEVIRIADWRQRLGVGEDPTIFFSDGVHPSALTYQTWGRDFAAFLLNRPTLFD